MYPPVKCFMVVSTNLVNRKLRRYATIPKGLPPCSAMPGEYSYHNAFVALDIVPDVRSDRTHEASGYSWPHFDERWPKECACGYVFKPEDDWQLFCESIWESETGEQWTLRDLPPGAMYDADWIHGRDNWCGEDGKALQVILPNKHVWHIDGPCINCTRPNDPHKCWVRHGTPPVLTVDKNGNTCSAGGGSIQAEDYHGFLRDGVLSAG